MKVVFVHGRGQGGLDAEELRLFWTGCLEAGFQAAHCDWPADLKTVLPFYADDLDRMVEKIDAPLITEILSRGESPGVAPHDELRGEMLAEMVAEKGLGNAAVEAEFAGKPLEKGPQNWPWILAMARVLDKTSFGGETIDRVTRDVSVYLTYGGVRNKVDQIVAQQIPANEPCVLVAHSLGTIVAYNVLAKRKSSGAEIPLLVTLGSPLGLSSVKAHLEKPLAVPPKVKHWYNARDAKDIVALFALDAQHFAVKPEIENQSDLLNGTDNHHSIDGYLPDPAVARQIWNGVTKLT